MSGPHAKILTSLNSSTLKVLRYSQARSVTYPLYTPWKSELLVKRQSTPHSWSNDIVAGFSIKGYDLSVISISNGNSTSEPKIAKGFCVFKFSCCAKATIGGIPTPPPIMIGLLTESKLNPLPIGPITEICSPTFLLESSLVPSPTTLYSKSKVFSLEFTDMIDIGLLIRSFSDTVA